MPSLTAPVQLSDHLYVVYAEFPHIDSSNVYLLTGATPTLIDCGSARGARQAIRNLASLGVAVRDLHKVIVTHGDFDHIQGLHILREQYPDLPLYLHPDDWPIVQEEDAYRNSSYLYGQPFLPFDARGFHRLEHGQRIPAGNTELTVHHTPGHTEGSVSLLVRVDGRDVLFAGDAIGGGMKALNGAIVELWVEAAVTWQRSVQALADLEFEWVLNGHEPVETLPIPRSVVDRLLASFGKMLNPWFTLGSEEPAADPERMPLSALVPAPGPLA